MHGFRGTLTDQQVMGVLAYVRMMAPFTHSIDGLQASRSGLLRPTTGPIACFRNIVHILKHHFALVRAGRPIDRRIEDLLFRHIVPFKHVHECLFFMIALLILRLHRFGLACWVQNSAWACSWPHNPVVAPIFGPGRP